MPPLVNSDFNLTSINSEPDQGHSLLEGAKAKPHEYLVDGATYVARQLLIPSIGFALGEDLRKVLSTL
jgi:hypothetical protein